MKQNAFRSSAMLEVKVTVRNINIIMYLEIILLTVSSLSSAYYHEFPKDFMFGTATSAYQIEGAWNENGKGESIWDNYAHDQPHRIADGSNGDIACDSYHKLDEDVCLLKSLGVQFYRFSLSWSRILPTGYIDKINPDGIRYYNELIDKLLENKITPVVTLYHWDLPYSLHEDGGWPNPFIVDYFADFARVAFEHFGDRVKLWLTLNEPFHICMTGYTTGWFAPGYHSHAAQYMCSYTALLAHAKAYHIYDEEYRPTQKGRLGITIDTFWYEPKTKSQADVDAAELAIQMNYGWFAHPIFSEEGDFPQLMKERIANVSASERLLRSRLPQFTQKEIDYIRGSSDFLGLNHYSTFQVSSEPSSPTQVFYQADLGVSLEQDKKWEATAAPWIKLTPWGLRKLLNWIKREYNNPTVYITESGMADEDGRLNDEQRVRYYRGFLGAILKAIHKDNCNVKAYTAWSLMDNYEWNLGYTLQFGLHHVNFTDPDRKRIPKASALYYKRVIQTRKIDHDYETTYHDLTEL